VKSSRYTVYVRTAVLGIIVLFGWATMGLPSAPTAAYRDSESAGDPGGAANKALRPGTIQRAKTTTAPTAREERSVIINNVRLSEEEVRTLESQYRVRILNGNYWYDRISGAWGYQGGPVTGVIAPFLDLGGPLQANASNGNTGVFVNGRELHILDVRALQQLGPVYPGRYWINAQGYYGFEGGPALGNLRAAANTTQPRREGILSTYDKTGAAVIGR
jgi:hypothetical protein